MHEKFPDSTAPRDGLAAYFQTPMSRRQLLTGAALAAGGAYSLLHWPQGMAQTAPLSQPGEHAFLRFSQAITGHQDLDPLTAKRMLQALTSASADFPAQLARLAELTRDKMEPKALLAAASASGLRDTALAVVAAWYTGTIEGGKQPAVVSYAQALMYRPVQDGQVVPTYCSYGPAWWTQAPPPIRVSAPVEKPAPEAPTTGQPAPTSGTPSAPKTAPQHSTPANNPER